MRLGKVNLKDNDCSIYIDFSDYLDYSKNPIYKDMHYSDFLNIFFHLNNDLDYDCYPPNLEGYYGVCVASLYEVLGHEGFYASTWHNRLNSVMGRLLVDPLGWIHLDITPFEEGMWGKPCLGEKVYESDLWYDDRGSPF